MFLANGPFTRVGNHQRGQKKNLKRVVKKKGTPTQRLGKSKTECEYKVSWGNE